MISNTVLGIESCILIFVDLLKIIPALKKVL